MGFREHPENINRKGRPKKGQTLTDAIERYAKRRDQEYTDPKTGEIRKRSRKDALAAKLWDLALSGDVAAMKYLYDRIDGMPKQSVDHSGSLTLEGAIRDAYQRRSADPGD